MSEDDQIDNERIKQRFRDAGCRVTDFDDGYFEVIRQPFPAASLVRANPYFVEFNTLVWARPSGFFGRTRSRRDSLLNQMNQVTKVAKGTCDQSSIDSDEGGWRVQAMARFVTGRIAQLQQLAAARPRPSPLLSVVKPHAAANPLIEFAD